MVTFKDKHLTKYWQAEQKGKFFPLSLHRIYEQITFHPQTKLNHYINNKMFTCRHSKPIKQD